MLTSLVSFLLLPQAQAFAPTDEVWIGTEPYRLLTTHTERQAELALAKEWAGFVAGEGEGWQARFDEGTLTAHRAWGPGIELGAPQTAADVERALWSFFERNNALLGVDLQALRLSSIAYLERNDTWFVDFDRLVGEVPIWRGGVTARIVQDRLVMLGIDTHPGASSMGTRPEISEDAARDAAIRQGPAPEASHAYDSARLVLLPQNQDGLRYPLVWETRTRTQNPPGIWVSHVDAHSGELLHVYNEVRFLVGEASATHDTRTVNGDTSTSPMPFLRIRNGQSSTFTNEAGVFALEDLGEGFTSDLNGQYVRVTNGNGENASAVFDGDTLTWSGDQVESVSTPELDSFVFLHHVRDWGLIYAPELDILQDKLRSNVSLDGSCNAYYDGSVNFYRAGDGCNNTGRIADVNYHEWGHGFHYYSLLAGTWDGSLSEGIGDIVSALLTGDSVIAPYFATSGSGIRNLAPDRVYPDDWVGETHTDGLIFGGAVWDLWGILEQELSSDEAFALVSQLFADAIKAGPTIPDAYDEFIVADDDDGDLGNGTPHQCQILEAFQRHGLGPMGNGSLLEISHEPLVNQLPDSVHAVSASVSNLAPECMEFTATDAWVHYSIDSGESWESAALEVLSEDAIDGAIPTQLAGSVVHYYLEVESSSGDTVLSPSGSTINPHSFYVGELVTLYCEDFESDDGGGYTHELLSGSNDEGADDWQLGIPAGAAGDPSWAFSGEQVWGNDLGWGNYNGEYQNDKHNRLVSLPIDVSEAEGQLVLQFRRWLTVEDGYYDHANILVDDALAWTNHGTQRDNGDEHHQDETWALHTLEIQDWDEDGDVVLSWEIESDQGLALGGWNIDDVCVYALVPPPETPNEDDNLADNELGSSGLQAVGGCACSSSGRQSSGTALMLLALALWRRRRSG